ncbi:hypothetical protein BT63DRAFT_427735 [Microthyrium microscopicum]|uniref:Uncharacterized protein n=1 Tax=Microthyrium microscopicum TaxID=703497 RepID=A0A6A6U2R0_9PEZI|nr:hypothetical protein BT63DRAFT_427735 [Microthyrium microscopicum]
MATYLTRYRYAKHGFAALDEDTAKHIRAIMNSEDEEDRPYQESINQLIREFNTHRKLAPHGLVSRQPRYLWRWDSTGRRTSYRDSPVPPGPVDHNHFTPKVKVGKSTPTAEQLAAAKAAVEKAARAPRGLHEIFFNPRAFNVEQGLSKKYEHHMKQWVSKDLGMTRHEVTMESFLIWEKLGYEKPSRHGWLKAQRVAEKEARDQEKKARLAEMQIKWRAEKSNKRKRIHHTSTPAGQIEPQTANSKSNLSSESKRVRRGSPRQDGSDVALNGIEDAAAEKDKREMHEIFFTFDKSAAHGFSKPVGVYGTYMKEQVAKDLGIACHRVTIESFRQWEALGLKKLKKKWWLKDKRRSEHVAKALEIPVDQVNKADTRRWKKMLVEKQKAKSEGVDPGKRRNQT